MNQEQQIGPHGLVIPFEPELRILPPEVIELLRHVLDREMPDFLLHRPDMVAEEKRRARILIDLHNEALQRLSVELEGARAAFPELFGDAP